MSHFTYDVKYLYLIVSPAPLRQPSQHPVTLKILQLPQRSAVFGVEWPCASHELTSVLIDI